MRRTDTLLKFNKTKMYNIIRVVLWSGFGKKLGHIRFCFSYFCAQNVKKSKKRGRRVANYISADKKAFAIRRRAGWMIGWRREATELFLCALRFGRALFITTTFQCMLKSNIPREFYLYTYFFFLLRFLLVFLGISSERNKNFTFHRLFISCFLEQELADGCGFSPRDCG